MPLLCAGLSVRLAWREGSRSATWASRSRASEGLRRSFDARWPSRATELRLEADRDASVLDAADSSTQLLSWAAGGTAGHPSSEGLADVVPPPSAPAVDAWVSRGELSSSPSSGFFLRTRRPPRRDVASTHSRCSSIQRRHGGMPGEPVESLLTKATVD